MDVCREVVPPEIRFADGVRVACHLYPNADAPMAGQLVPVAVVGVDAPVAVSAVSVSNSVVSVPNSVVSAPNSAVSTPNSTVPAPGGPP
jgi:hypothetical protein